MNKNVIIEKWNEFLKISFPDIADDDLHLELAEIDTFSAGCISSYIEGKLNQECMGLLQKSFEDIPKLLQPGNEDVNHYFELLYEIVEDIKSDKGF